MADQQAASQPKHTLTLEGRSRLTVTGVTDVPSFCEESIVAEVEGGAVTIAGEGLHIARLSLSEGALSVEGRVTALEYSDRTRAGLWRRIWK